MIGGFGYVKIENGFFEAEPYIVGLGRAFRDVLLDLLYSLCSVRPIPEKFFLGLYVVWVLIAGTAALVPVFVMTGMLDITKVIETIQSLGFA